MVESARVRNVMLGVITFVLVIWFLRVSWLVTMPLALAVFLATVLWPLQRRLERSVPHWLSVAGTLAALAAACAIVAAALWYAVAQITTKGPQYSDIIRTKFESWMQWARQRGVPVTWETFNDQATLQSAISWLGAYVASAWTALALLTLVLFLLVLLLFEINHWRRKADLAFEGDTSRAVVQSMATIVKQLHSYMLVRTLVSLISGVVTALWCLLLGIEFAIVWGLLAFLLNYLPNIGSLISFVPPTLFALVQYDWQWALLALACLSVTDAILGNVIDPLIQGRSLRLSPLVVLVAVLFWGWVWGIAGALLGVPITASLAIICNHVEGLRPIGRLLSSAKGR